MKLNGLVDDKRRGEIRLAVQQGKSLFKKKAAPALIAEHPAAEVSLLEKYRQSQLLVLAITCSSVETAQDALSKGAHVDYRSDDGFEMTRVTTLAALNKSGSELEEIEAPERLALDQGDTCLMLAAKKGNIALVELLIAHGADINASTNYGHCPYPTALSYARQYGHQEIVELLIRHGALG